jgi:hypothetical protein
MKEYSKAEQARNEDSENVGIYSEEGREDLMENEDQITDVDEGFMKGYEDYKKPTKCSNCKASLEGHEVIEKDFKRKIYRFCSRHCLTEFEINHQEEEGF